MVGKQFSVSVMNLATSSSHSTRANHSMNHRTNHFNLLEERKHALSEENLPSMVSWSKVPFVRSFVLFWLNKRFLSVRSTSFLNETFNLIYFHSEGSRENYLFDRRYVDRRTPTSGVRDREKRFSLMWWQTIHANSIENRCENHHWPWE